MKIGGGGLKDRLLYLFPCSTKYDSLFVIREVWAFAHKAKRWPVNKHVTNYLSKM